VTSAFVPPHSRDAIDYYKRNHDWRGRASFFRDGYNFAVSTQNFNHTAAMGALLGGAIIDGAWPAAEGRHGLEYLPLRFWAFLDGTTQEMLDHYICRSRSAPEDVRRLRALADRSPDGPHPGRPHHGDAYKHPSSQVAALRGLVGPGADERRAGRAGRHLRRPAHRLQDGRGQLSRPTGLGQGARHAGVGLRLPAGPRSDPKPAVAVGTGLGAGLVDNKPVPFEETSAETTRGYFKPPLWRRSWLGAWHGLASTDIRGGTVNVLGQWVREAKVATRMEDLGTLTVRYVANEPELASTSGGTVAQAGLTLTFQSRNRAIIFAKPHTTREHVLAPLGRRAMPASSGSPP